ncbi:MAG: hypothetical protein NTW05_28015 [Pseudonocardiales bacterium]|nr:hypothetical protein [Pseudonocardiales bacterium]
MQVIHRYLLGEPPAANELLFWVADQVNVAGALQRDLRPAILDSALLHPGALTVLGRPIDVSRVEVPTYGVGGTGDYLTPWQGCLRSLTAMAGPARFALTPGGHLSALLAAPGARSQHYRIGPVRGDVSEWEGEAESRDGSWWDDWTSWLSAGSTGSRPVSGSLGSAAHPAGEPAPGTYVHRSLR